MKFFKWHCENSWCGIYDRLCRMGIIRLWIKLEYARVGRFNVGLNHRFLDWFWTKANIEHLEANWLDYMCFRSHTCVECGDEYECERLSTV
jgi:hypothetical protein